MTQRVVIWAVALTGTLTLAGCGQSKPNTSEGPSTSGNVLRLNMLGAASVASQEVETVLDLGRDSERPEYLFHRIRAGILTDDGFWIANGGSNEIRFYSSDGSFQFALGGSGQGPGEFTSLRSMLLLEPDRLFVFDTSGRATVFGPERQVLRTFDVPWFEDGLRATEYVRLGARRFAALVKSPRDPREHIGETRRDTVELVVADASGRSYRRTGVRIPDRWWKFSETTAAFVADTPPDGPSALVATLGPNLATSTSESPELRVWTIDALDSANPSEVAVELEQVEMGGVAPRAIDQLVGSDDGGLWIGLHPADEDAVRTWIWVDSNAEVAARLELPGNLWLLDVRGDQFLVRATDPQGDQSVQVLAVR